MILKLKNKHILALSTILEKAYQLNGVPKYFELHPSEAYQLLIEINELYQLSSPSTEISGANGYVTTDRSNDPLSKISIVQISETTGDARLILYGKTPITRKVGEELVKRWYAKEFHITYSGIELHVKPPAKKKPTITATVSAGKTVTGTVLPTNPPKSR